MNMRFGGTGVALLSEVTTGEFAMSVDAAGVSAEYSAKTQVASRAVIFAIGKLFMILLLFLARGAA
ncbi:MAG: hypothetical protein BGO63_02120 [Candidatus Accumulibacter sp. 66-26]|nr:MAG: hypothetical protein BGO63_02120 [Candidatus Accumulibacter sp. 66-26]